MDLVAKIYSKSAPTMRYFNLGEVVPVMAATEGLQ